jgi:SAM-dependent methyltransferase
MGLDAQAWLQRWDRQQEGYVPDREATFALMFDVLDRLGAAPGRLLDLACGPGSLADRALARYPGAEVVGLDLDLVMLELARRTLGDRVRWVDADLRSPAWTDGLGEFDAVVSATALHWLDAEHLPTLPDGLAAALRPGGVFLDFDTLLADPDQPRLAALTRDLRVDRTDRRIAGNGFEDFGAWWAALAEEPELDELEHLDRRADRVRGPEAVRLHQHLPPRRRPRLQEGALSRLLRRPRRGDRGRGRRRRRPLTTAHAARTSTCRPPATRTADSAGARATCGAYRHVRASVFHRVRTRRGWNCRKRGRGAQCT